MNNIYENITVFEVRIKENTQYISYFQKELESLRADTCEIQQNVDADAIVNKFSVSLHKDIIKEVISSIRAGSWKTFRNKIEHTSGKSIMFQKGKTELAIAYKDIDMEQLQEILMVYGGYIRLQENILYIELCPKTKELTTTLV